MKSREEIEAELADTTRNLADCPHKDGLLARDLEARRRALAWVLAPSEWTPVKSDNGAPTNE